MFIGLECAFEVSGNSFSNNTAQVNGGAIYYDLFSPVGLLNNTFANNSAQYGMNYASYPFRLKIIDTMTPQALVIKPIQNGTNLTTAAVAAAVP